MRHSPLLSILVLSIASPLAGQTVTSRATELLAAAGSRPVATLMAGADVKVESTRGRYTEVTIEGFVSAGLLAGARERFPISVRGDGARLREGADASSTIVAQMREGMGLQRVGRRGDWVQVRRTGWVATSALRPPSQAASRRQQDEEAGVRRARDTAVSTIAGDPAGAGAPDTVMPVTSPRGMMAGAEVALRAAPDGASLATVGAATPVTPLARERGWVRVRIEGWVPEAAVVPSDTSSQAMLSAADLRADPDGTRGKLVRWDVEVLALQTADPLRRDLRQDEPYFLARGPGSENALLYLAIPPALLEIARQIPPLAEITISARVRTGRSQPVGVPILDLLQIARR